MGSPGVSKRVEEYVSLMLQQMPSPSRVFVSFLKNLSHAFQI